MPKKIFLFKVMHTVHNKIKPKIIENLPFCIQDILITYRNENKDGKWCILVVVETAMRKTVHILT